MILDFVALLGICASGLSAPVSDGYESRDECALAFSLSKERVETVLTDDDIPESGVQSTLPYFPNLEIENSGGTSLQAVDPHNKRQLNDFEYNLYPYKCVVRLYVGFDSNGDGIADYHRFGTGSLVGPHTILSCAHLIYSNDDGWCVTLEAQIGYHKSSSTGEIVYTASYTEWTNLTIGNYRNTLNNNDDWSILDLEEDVGNQYGYLGVSSSFTSVGTSVLSCGYHGDLEGNMGVSLGTITRVYSYSFAFNRVLVGGASGGPVMYGGSTVIGINASTNGYDTSYACSVSSYIVSWIGERL